MMHSALKSVASLSSPEHSENSADVHKSILRTPTSMGHAVDERTVFVDDFSLKAILPNPADAFFLF